MTLGFFFEVSIGFFFFFAIFFFVAGFSGAILTGAVSVAVTFGPTGGFPVATATLLKLFVTFGRVHM